MRNQTDIGDTKINNLVSCNLGQYCNYTITDSKDPKNNQDYKDLCQCGFNSIGQGYCKLGQNMSI